MVVDVQPKRGGDIARVPSSALKTVRPKLFRRASLTSWGKDNLKMTRAAAVNLKELMLTVQQQKYEDRDRAAQREMSRHESCEGDLSIRNRNQRREKLLLRSIARRDFYDNWEREGRAKWNANQAALCRYERRLLSYELAVRATAEARQRISRARHVNDQIDGVRWFENNLDRLGLDPGGGGASGGGRGGTGGDTLLPDKETTATFRSRLVRTVLEQKFVPSSNAETMAELRFRGATGRRGRQEREYRRVKSEVDQRHAKAETDAQRFTNRHLQGMLHDGRQRRELAAACWVRRQNLEQKAVSDMGRFAVRAAAQEDRFEVAFNARARRARERYEACGAEREEKAGAMRARLQRDREEKRRGVELMCLQVVNKMTDLAVVASETRASQRGVPLPPTSWAKLKRWFCSPDPFFVDVTPPEPLSEPNDPALDAKVAIELRNLDNFEGSWRLRGDLPQEISNGPSPLSRALSVAREVVEATGSGPREAPTHGGSGSDPATVEQRVSLKLVILGCGEQLGELCTELGRWTRLYVCSVEKALECAMEVGAEAAASDGKGGKGRKGSVSGRKGSLGEEAESDTGNADVGGAKGAANSKCFHPDATGEDVSAFKAAAVAYHALRTHPKKAAAPVPLAMTTDLLVKHLSCFAPSGRGWILLDYPRTLLEAKLLENALGGYTDEEVAVELGKNTKPPKPDPKPKKGVNPQQQSEEEPKVLPRSGLDAVLSLPSSRAGETLGSNQSAAAAGVEGSENSSMPNGVPSTPHASGDANVRVGNNDERLSNEGDSTGERDARTLWWRGFEGGNLWCDVPNEANNERLLETLFLLVNAAQNRKKDYESWQEINVSARKIEDDAAAQALEGGVAAEPDADAAKTSSTASSTIDRSSPLAVPLTAHLEDLRSERRASMSDSTRIHVEALTGERELDLELIRSVISQADAQQERAGNASETVLSDDTDARTPSPPLRASMRKLEAQCPAPLVVEWVALAQFSFCEELRAPDNRWAAACVQLEGQLAGWFSRVTEVLAAAPNSRSGGGGAKRDSGGERSMLAWEVPAEGGPVWEALEAFQLETGNVIDDRHSSAEEVVRQMDAEADRKMHAWIGDVEGAAADLCAAERAGYHRTVETLRSLDRLFGLEEDCTRSSADRIREATALAAEALTSGLSAASEGLDWAGGAECLREEIRRAVQEVRRPAEITPTASEVRQIKSSPSESQQDTLVYRGHQGIGGGTAGTDATAGADSEPTNGGAETLIYTSGDESKGGRASEALTTAIWQCRLRYICRLRGVVTRLVRAVAQCGTRVLSMRTALRRHKRRRVQLEHQGFSVACSAVRRALEESDHATITDMIKNGIPVWLDDKETFAADPNVALPWGMNGLDVAHIASLTRALRCNLAGLEGEVRGTFVPVSDLSRAVKAWALSEVSGNKRDGGRGGIPLAWTGQGDGYVDTLCEAVAGGTKTGKVSWRRLVNGLLLGHVQSLPTLEDLRSMRLAFSLKAAKASRTSIGAIPDGFPAGGFESAENALRPTLRIAQRHLPGIPFWFEQRDSEAEICRERGVREDLSSTIRGVYIEGWGQDDGRVDGMDLLLTLCAVPNDSPAGAVSLQVDEEGGEENGVPFSLGLFRAFAMLAESPSSENEVPGAEPRRPLSAGTMAAPSSSAANPPEELSTLSCNPCVSLPHLRAILQHGGGMTVADVSDICELVMEKESGFRQMQAQCPKTEQILTAAVVVSGAAAEGATDVPAAALEPHVAGDAAGEGVEAAAVALEAQHDGKNEAIAALTETCEDRDIPTREEAVESARRESGLDVERYELELQRAAFTASFATVSECEAVRKWVRNGAYTLPAFDTTSGQRRDIGTGVRSGD